MERSPWLNLLTALLAVIAALYLFGRIWEIAANFADIILLFFLAWLLAFILKPIAKFLSNGVRVPWPLAVGLVYLGLFVVLVAAAVVLVPILALQLAQLSTALPKWAEEVPGLLAPLQSALADRGLDVNLDRWLRIQDLPVQIERFGTLLIQNALGIVTGVASAVFSAIIVLILSFYLLQDGDRLADEALLLVPRSSQRSAKYLFESIDRTFGGFLRGQLLQALIYGMGTSVVMLVGGLGYVAAVSLFAGAMMFVPFFGPFLALVPPLLIAMFQLEVSGVIMVLVALLVLQQVVLNILAPKIMSESVGIHPLLVFLAILGGAKMAGLAGAIFGVPVVGVLNAMAWHFYRQSDAYRNRGQKVTPSPIPTRSRDFKEGWRHRALRMGRGFTGALGKRLTREP